MRSAPPVSVHASGGLPWRLLRTALPALAGGAAAAWALGHLGGAAAWALPVMAGVALLAWRAAAPVAVGLSWDGQHWRADDIPSSLDVMVDAGAALLLRLRPDAAGARVRWIAVTAIEAGPAWHALRAAAYARAPRAPVGAAPDGLRLPR